MTAALGQVLLTNGVAFLKTFFGQVTSKQQPEKKVMETILGLFMVLVQVNIFAYKRSSSALALTRESECEMFFLNATLQSIT